MNSISSCGLFWAKQPLALFALLISQMGKRDDIWHQKRITQKNFINIFLLSSLDSSSVSGREHCSLEMCWKQWTLPVCSLYSFHFIFRLFKDCNIGCWTWTLTPGSHSGWLILDEACVAPGLSRECYDLPSKERGKWKHSLVVSSPLGDNSFFSCSWQKEEAGPPLPFWVFFFRENRSAFILLGVSLSHLDVTITRKCQEWITVPFSTLVTAGGFCVSLKTKPPKCSRLENPFFGIYILPTPG